LAYLLGTVGVVLSRYACLRSELIAHAMDTNLECLEVVWDAWQEELLLGCQGKIRWMRPGIGPTLW